MQLKILKWIKIILKTKIVSMQLKIRSMKNKNKNNN